MSKTNVKIFAENIGQVAIDHINRLAELDVWVGDIVIMPDGHEGKGAVIGTTVRANTKKGIIPNVIGVDLGCGVSAYPLSIDYRDIDLNKLDIYIRKCIPMGFSGSKSLQNKYALPRDNMYEELGCGEITNKMHQLLIEQAIFSVNHLGQDMSKMEAIPGRAITAMGSLGGGNHFVEVAYAVETGEAWVLIHSGSRNPGLQIATFHQKLASNLHEMLGTGVDKDMCWLPSNISKVVLNDIYSAKHYYDAMKVAQEWASMNRKLMLAVALTYFDENLNEDLIVESVHNYIDFTQSPPMIRKGAISAYAGESVIIPMNMAYGSILGIGKGNGEWNYSAPHGAGRLMSRKKAKETIRPEDVARVMKEHGVLNSHLESCLDEAPQAYKDPDEIVRLIEPTVEVVDRLLPILNIKGN